MKIEEKYLDALHVVGLKIITSNDNESSPDTAKIPALWQQFFSENIEEQIPDRKPGGNILGVYSDYDSELRGVYSVIVGREVTAIQKLPADMAAVTIPAARYLVFSDEGEMPKIIYSLWQSIWEYFADNSDHRRLYTADFERYPADESSRVEIYIAIAA